jgi:carboxyl-terminal processing protease
MFSWLIGFPQRHKDSNKVSAKSFVTFVSLWETKPGIAQQGDRRKILTFKIKIFPLAQTRKKEQASLQRKRPAYTLLLMLGLTCFASTSFTQTPPATTTFENITQLIRQQYVDSVNIDSIVRQMVSDYLNNPETIAFLLKKLDPHTTFFPPKDFAEFRMNLANSIKGIGIVFGMVADTVIITKVMKGGPAYKSGVHTGDRIISVNDSLIAGKHMDFFGIADKLRGKQGTIARVKILRREAPVWNDITIVRDSVPLTSVDFAGMLDKETGYILISRFAERTASEVRSALTRLNNEGMKKLVLDLRNNLGGYMTEAVNTADEFLSGHALIVYTMGLRSPRNDHYADKPGLFEKGAMVVLVNQSTASAGEILTAALKENKRATIIGRRTYGKGLVQVVYTLADSVSGMKLTTARYYTPEGHCLQRSYSSGVDAYMSEYASILENGGELPDSLEKKIGTDWGVQPDIHLAGDTSISGKLLDQLNYNFYIQNFAYAYYADHVPEFAAFKTTDEFNRAYHITDAFFEKFGEYIAGQEKDLPPGSPRLVYTNAELDHIRPVLETILKARLAQEKWNDEGFYFIMNPMDKEIRVAMDVLKKKR